MFIDFLSGETDSRLILRMILAVDDDESEMICWYVLSPLDLASTHAKVPELRGVEVESLGGPGGGPLWPWGSGGLVSVPMAVAMGT